MPKIAPIKHQGNKDLFLAVEMSLISTLAGVPLHVHAEGLRGTGKTTVMRWARHAVPDIRQYKGCPYHCLPDYPHCPVHGGKGPAGAGMAEDIPMPFIEIGHGAKLGTILGSIDLEKLTSGGRPEACILPGSIPMANRGIVFIDEVNRLAETAPEITDVLLSVMGTKPGRVKIEEVGLPACEVEVTASVWAASNPDEDPGPLEEIRRQLADRFDLVVPVQRPSDPAVIERLLLREGETSALEIAFGDIVEKARRFGKTIVPQPILRYMAQLYVHRNVESLRAIEALELCSRLCAAMAGKDEVTFDEVSEVLPLVMRHRLEPLTLSEILKDVELRRAAGSRPNPEPEDRACDGGGDAENKDAQPDARQNAPDLPALPAQDGCKAIEGSAGTGRRESDGKPVAGGGRQNWLREALSRYRDSLRTRGGRQASMNSGAGRGNTEPAPEGRPGSRSFIPVPNPKDISPVSPLEQARRLSSLTWEDSVDPAEWKNLSP